MCRRRARCRARRCLRRRRPPLPAGLRDRRGRGRRRRRRHPDADRRRRHRQHGRGVCGAARRRPDRLRDGRGVRAVDRSAREPSAGSGGGAPGAPPCRDPGGRRHASPLRFPAARCGQDDAGSDVTRTGRPRRRRRHPSLPPADRRPTRPARRAQRTGPGHGRGDRRRDVGVGRFPVRVAGRTSRRTTCRESPRRWASTRRGTGTTTTARFRRTWRRSARSSARPRGKSRGYGGATSTEPCSSRWNGKSTRVSASSSRGSTSRRASRSWPTISAGAGWSSAATSVTARSCKPSATSICPNRITSPTGAASPSTCARSNSCNTTSGNIGCTGKPLQALMIQPITTTEYSASPIPATTGPASRSPAASSSGSRCSGRRSTSTNIPRSRTNW